MLKAEKIYRGFYSCGEYAIENKLGGYWYVYDKYNKCVTIKPSLKRTIEYINKWLVN